MRIDSDILQGKRLRKGRGECENAEEVIPGEGTAFTLEIDALIRGTVGLEEIDGQTAQNVHVFSAVAETHAALVLAEIQVKDPMQGVFDGPMAANRIKEFLRGRVRIAEYEEARGRLGSIRADNFA